MIIPSISDVLDFYFDDWDNHIFCNNKKMFDLVHIDGLYEYIINTDWVKNKYKILKFIKILENHLTNHLNQYILDLKSYGLKNISLFETLAFSYLSLKNYEEALDYFLLIKDFVGENKELEKIISILETGSNTDYFNSYEFKQPFINDCYCRKCALYYPKKIYNLMKSFY